MSATIRLYFSQAIHHYLAPPIYSERVRDFLNQSSTLATPEHSFYKRHFKSVEYCAAAWVMSIFDTFSIGSKLLSDILFDAVEWSMQDVMEDIKENGVQFLHSIKLNMVLPFFIYAGFFIPKIFTIFHYEEIAAVREGELQARANNTVSQENLAIIEDQRRTMENLTAQNANLQRQITGLRQGITTVQSGLSEAETRLSTRLQQQMSDVRELRNQTDQLCTEIVYRKRIIAFVHYKFGRVRLWPHNLMQSLTRSNLLSPEGDPRQQWDSLQNTFNSVSDIRKIEEISNTYPLISST